MVPGRKLPRHDFMKRGPRIVQETTGLDIYMRAGKEP